MANEWQPIDDWYEVSNDGLVRSIAKQVQVGQWKNHNGYLLVRLRNPRRQERVHRLVAKAFIPNPQQLPFVNHLDCDRANNRVENLEWCTQKQNLTHSEKLGRMKRNYWTGKRSPNAFLSEAKVSEIKSEYAKGELSWEALGKKHGVSKRTIGSIVKGQSYV